MSAKPVVSVGQQSETTTNGHAASAARTRSARGMLAAGLVATIHSALTAPSSTASNSSTAFSPGLVASRRATRTGARDRIVRIVEAHMRGELIGKATNFAPAHRVRLAGQRNGPMPGRPIRPVARWQLMIALTLSVPNDD